MENCLFCKIVKWEISSHNIYEDEYTYAFLDISKNPEGHTLVIPKVHAENLCDVTSDVYNKVNETALKISKYYRKIGFADAVNIYINSGKPAGQEVMHLHVHIIPRKKEDCILFNHTKKESQRELSDVCKQLKLN